MAKSANFIHKGLLKKSILTVMILAGTGFINGCENMSNQDVGTIVGGATGALVGSQFGKGSGRIWTTAAGAVAGGMIGSNVGSRLDELDRMRADQAYQQAASSSVGSTITWSNPHSGHHGTVRSVREGRSSYGDYCREFQSTVFIEGRKDTVYSTACRGQDGRWYAAQ